MADFQSNNWNKTEIEKQVAEDEIELFGLLKTKLADFVMLETDEKILNKDDLKPAIKFE